MFGYVRPPDLPPVEAARFRRMYCSLCHALGRRYGSAARWTLNYDFTFLAILLSDGTEGDIVHGRCPVHPVHGREYLASTPSIELAADESVILAYWQLRDGVEDQDFSLPYRAASSVLRKAYHKAAQTRPAFDRAVREQLDALHRLEQERCPSLDRPADAFAVLLQSAACEAREPVRRRVLEQLLYHLGRWIYLIDAADDLRRDAVTGDYNPVALRYGLQRGVWTPEARAAFALTLDHSIHAMAAAFELWDFGVWRPVLEATLYEGLFRTGRAVLDGTWRAGPLSRRRDDAPAPADVSGE